MALRAVFTGIGRALMVADRPAMVAQTAGAEARFGRSDQPGNVAPVRVSAAPPAAASETASDETESTVGLPLPNYDALSLASIRARLRGLDTAQLRVLLDYEAANAERTDVLGMFERRIEKLEAGA